MVAALEGLGPPAASLAKNMVGQGTILAGCLLAAAFFGPKQDTSTPSTLERLEAITAAIVELGDSSDAGRELYLRMESGFALVELERFAEARPFFERALVLSREMGEPGMEITNLSSLLEVAFRLGDLERARDISIEGIEVAESMGRADYVQNLLINLGSVQQRLGNFEKAVEALARALELHDDESDPLALATLLSNLAVAHMSLADYEQALIVLDRALPIMLESRQPDGIAAVLSNQADIHLLTGHPVQALELMQRVLELREDYDLEGDSSISHRGIGQALHALGQSEEALESFERALAIQRRLELGPEIVATLVAQAEVLASLNRFDEAKTAAMEGEGLADAMRMRDRHVLTLHALAQAHEGQGDLVQALRYEREARVLLQQTNSTDVAHALADVRLQYENQLSKHELSLLRKDNELKRQQRDFLMAGSVLLLLAALAGWTFFLINRRVLRRLDQTHRDLHAANEGIVARSKQLELAMENIRELEEERLRAGKLESIGVLAAGIAHDFNNVLAVVLGNLSLVQETLGPQTSEQQMLEDAKTAVTHGRRLSSQLLTFSKGGEPLRELRELAPVLREVADLSATGSNSRLCFDLPSDLWSAEFDLGQISQLTSNLVLNAVQAMPEGGMINISARNIEPDSRAGHENRLIRVRVTDTGPGVPEAVRQQIFDPYFTTKAAGTGLGLTTAYAIAKRHGGTLRLRSDENGSAFEFDLPAALKAAPPAHAEQTDYERGTGRILVLDDDPLILAFYERALLELGYHPLLAQDGDQAVEHFDRAQEEQSTIHAAILDLTLPGGRGGIEVLADLRQRDPALRAIVASGYSDAPVISNFREAGFEGVLVKPFEIEGLSRVLTEVLTDSGRTNSSFVASH